MLDFVTDSSRQKEILEMLLQVHYNKGQGVALCGYRSSHQTAQIEKVTCLGCTAILEKLDLKLKGGLK